MKQSIEVPAELVTIHEATANGVTGDARGGLVRHPERLGRELHRDTPNGGNVTMHVDQAVTLQTVLWHDGKPFVASAPHYIGAGAQYRFGPCTLVFSVPEDPDPLLSLL